MKLTREVEKKERKHSNKSRASFDETLLSVTSILVSTNSRALFTETLLLVTSILVFTLEGFEGNGVLSDGESGVDVIVLFTIIQH